MSDNVDVMLDALKRSGKRLLQLHDEIRRRLFGSGETDDPHAAVRVPAGHKPPGRAGAIALEEPHSPVRVEAVGRRL